MKNISVTDFKKKYPRQYFWLINYYGGKKNVFDISAAISLYLRKMPPPTCSVCKIPLSITKKFRNSVENPRCKYHVNSNNIISLEQLKQASEEFSYDLVFVPNKLLSKTDQIEVACSKHGTYKVNIGNFLKGMECQKCYHESRVGKPRAPHSEETRKILSSKKQGTKVNYTIESKKLKRQNQKIAWKKRKDNAEEYQLYLKNLSEKRKKYIKDHGFQFPNKEQTGLEKRFENFLIEANIKYKTQYLLGNKKFDFYLEDMSLLVEIDGEYWHNFPSSIKNDAEKHEISLRHNIQLVRISSDNFNPEIIFDNHEIQNQQNKQILQKRGIDGF